GWWSRRASSSEIERHPVLGALELELGEAAERLPPEVREEETPARELRGARGDLRVRHVDPEPRLVGRALADEEIGAARALDEVVGPRRGGRVEDRPSRDGDPVAGGGELGRVRDPERQDAYRPDRVFVLGVELAEPERERQRVGRRLVVERAE